MTGRALAAAAALLLAAAPAAAQVTVVAPGRVADQVGLTFGKLGATARAIDTDTPLPVGGVQESFALAAGNVASAARTVYGGQYLFAQGCSSYGSVALQVLGPDGATWLTMASYTSADTTGGHAATLASGAVVRVTLAATAGCNATLGRVP